MTTHTGVQFPEVEGRRSTQQTSRDVFSTAVVDVDPVLAEAINGERDWRRHYPRHLRELTARAAVSAQAASSIARAGLRRLHEGFEFVDAEGSRSLSAAVAEPPTPHLGTRTVTGQTDHPGELVVPYRGEDLRGGRIVDQAAAWADRGVVEPAFVDAIRRVVEHPEWLDLRGLTFGILGAGAEMGPTKHLLSWGATVAAVDVPVDDVWARLRRFAEAGSGILHEPVRPDGAAGVDLVTEPAAVRAWLAEFGDRLVIGNYAYAGGAMFPRVAMAADAVIVDLQRRIPGAALAYLATPTDVFAVPEAAVAMARSRQSGNAAVVIRTLSGGRAFVPRFRTTLTTEDGRSLGIADSLIVQQGPNYALAKRLQRWRGLVARQDGFFSSVHVAPATMTRSVMDNRLLAAAYRGAHLFDVEVFAPETSRAVMSALLVHDLRSGDATADPAGGSASGEHDLTASAVHGGLWRIAWEPRSALPFAVLAGAKGLLGR